VTRPISASLIGISVLLLAAPVMLAFFRRKEILEKK
jgi:hypothetical protein